MQTAHVHICELFYLSLQPNECYYLSYTRRTQIQIIDIPAISPLFDNTCTCSLVARLNNHLITKPTKWHVRQAKSRINLGIRPVWSESSLSAWGKLGSLATHLAHSKDSDQTGRMPRLIWVFAGHTCHYVGFVTRWLRYINKILSKWRRHAGWFASILLPYETKLNPKFRRSSCNIQWRHCYFHSCFLLSSCFPYFLLSE